MQNPNKVIEEINKIQNDNLEGIKEIRNLKYKENSRIRGIRQFEAYKWNQFKDIVKGKKFFRFEHIEKLGIKPNLIIHLSAKNAGKTTELYRKMNEIIRRGEKFLYGRVYKHELDGARFQFENDELCPVILLARDNRYYIYKKTDIELWKTWKMEDLEDQEDFILGTPKIADFNKLGIKPVGLGYTFFNSNTLGGMNYDGYSAIFFDEILSYSPINRINKKVLDGWDASISTITRTKPNIDIYMMGNLLDQPEHPILNFYGINIDDELRIIKRGENGECTILFVNSGGLYEATFKNQAGVTKHGDIEHQTFLKNNKLLKTSTNILTPKIFDAFKFDRALALSFVPDFYYLELRTLQDEDNEEFHYCLKCDLLKITTILQGDIYSDEPSIYNTFENVKRGFFIKSMFNMVYRLYKSKSLKFDSAGSHERYRMLIRHHKALLNNNEQSNR